jgi:hypothetical protein
MAPSGTIKKTSSAIDPGRHGSGSSGISLCASGQAWPYVDHRLPEQAGRFQRSAKSQITSTQSQTNTNIQCSNVPNNNHQKRSVFEFEISNIGICLVLGIWNLEFFLFSASSVSLRCTLPKDLGAAGQGEMIEGKGDSLPTLGASSDATDEQSLDLACTFLQIGIESLYSDTDFHLFLCTCRHTGRRSSPLYRQPF